MHREDFPILKNDLIYFDNGATSLKPQRVVDAIVDYYTKYTANAHRGDYDNSIKVDEKYANSRKIIKDFIHAKSTKEIIFTSGTTDSLNRIVFGYFENQLQENDEVLVTVSEHASNLLPWFELEDKKGIKVRYIELDSNYEVTIENLKKAITPHTKVISLAHITNVIGDVRPIEEIIKIAHQNHILCVIDGAQSVPHLPVDVQKLDLDFLTFSGHKMCGPTGIGVLYVKEDLLPDLKPITYGGGMNASFAPNGERLYHTSPDLYEAGTQHIAGIIGLGEAIQYLEEIGMESIHQYEVELKEYAVKRLKEIPQITIYNEHSQSGIISFNYEGIFAQDLAIYLNRSHISIRSGSHCAKILNQEIGIKNTCRISFYFYNTKEEIDRMIEVLKNPHIYEEII